MIQRFAFRSLLILAAASVVTAQNAPPGTRCTILSEATPRCNHPGKNTPPTITLKIDAEDKRKLDLCSRELISAGECSAVEGRIRLVTVASDLENDQLLYTYSTTAGRITQNGLGPDASWNMSGHTAGTYITTVEVNDGCGCVSFSSVSLALTRPAPKWLDGIWSGIGYQWDIEGAWPLTFSAVSDKYTVDYPSLKCSGRWNLLTADGDTATFKEEITTGVENCAQGETVRIKKLSTGELGVKFTHAGETEAIAAAVLIQKPAKRSSTTKAKKKSRR